MKRLLHHRPSGAMLVALVALFGAIGGGAYAAVTLPANSVGTTQLRNGAVTAPKLKARSLLASDFKAGQLPRAAKGDTGATGAQGTRGDTGATGAQEPKATTTTTQGCSSAH